MVDLDKNGSIERCSISTSVSAELDTLAMKTIYKSKFEPAFENGQAVSSSIRIDVQFLLDSLISGFTDVSPMLVGNVTDQITHMPVAGANVRMMYTGAFQDTSLHLTMERYLSLIGKISNLKYENGIFITQTDSLGKFKLCLLPSGCINFSVSSSGYEINHQSTCLRDDRITTADISLIPAAEFKSNSDYEITVYGKSHSNQNVIKVRAQEVSSGMTHSLGEIIEAGTTLKTSSKSKSALLVRACSPYDILYLINGIPMSSPTHFSGFSFGEIDGVMIGSVSEMKVTVDDIAGRYPSVSGALIEVTPTIISFNSEHQKPRPELSIDLGSTGSIDALFSNKSKRDTANSFQIGGTLTNAHEFKWRRIHYNLQDDANLGLGYPENFGNITLTSKLKGRLLKFENFGWLALDSYSPYYPSPEENKRIVPWGMLSCKISPIENDLFTMNIGGSHEIFFEGKRVGYNSFLKEVEKSSGSLLLNRKGLNLNFAKIDIEGRLSYLDWKGYVLQRSTMGIDSSIHQSGKEIDGYGQCTFSFYLGDVHCDANVLFSGRISDKNFLGDLDLGGMFYWPIGEFSLGLMIGKTVSYPDFRGLPDTNFRLIRQNTFLSSIFLKYQKDQFFKANVQPYFRLQDSLPQTNPLMFVWDTASLSQLRAYGCEFYLNLSPARWIDFNASVDLSSAARYTASRKTIYEWQSPYFITYGIHTNFFQNFFHIHLNGHIKAGNYYYDFSTQNFQKLPTVWDYSLSFQIRNEKLKYRFLTRFDVYLTLKNIEDVPVVRDYYWDQNMKKVAIVSDGVSFCFGLKTSFKF